MPIDFEELKSVMQFASLEKNLILVEDISMVPYSEKPSIMPNSISVIIESGSIDIGINLNRYTISAPSLLIVFAGQITQHFSKSDDFKGLFISNSKQFADYLEVNMQKALSFFFEVRNRPFVSLTQEELEILKEHYYLLKKAVNHTNNSFQYEVCKHLMLAFFYLSVDITLKHKKSEDEKKTKQDILFESFYKYVQLYYKQERELGFYADKLCITPKYLSSVIKSTTGKSANEWIDSHVILEAQALLKSSKMTIQQISDELNFPSQSFFGKYFKRHVGVSPKEYKQS